MYGKNVNDVNLYMIILILLLVYVDDGYWRGGRFLFEVTVPSNYNIVVSIATAVKIQL